MTRRCKNGPLRAGPLILWTERISQEKIGRKRNSNSACELRRRCFFVKGDSPVFISLFFRQHHRENTLIFLV